MRANSKSKPLIQRLFLPHHGLARFLPLLVLLAMLLVSLVFYLTLRRDQLLKNREALEIASSHFSDTFKQTIERRVLAISRMSLRWEYLGFKEATEDSRKFDASLNVKNYPGLQSIQFWDAQFQPSWKVPATGGNLSPELLDDLAKTINKASVTANSSDPVLTSWKNPQSGEIRWLIVAPVHFTYPHHGYLVGLLEIPDLITAALSTSQQNQLVLELKQGEDLVFRSTDKTAANGLISQLTVQSHGHSWISRHWPTVAYRRQLESSLPLWVLLAGIFNALLFAAITNLLLHSRRTAAALQEAEADVRLILASAGNGIIGVDLEGHCTFINPAALAMLGFDKTSAPQGETLHTLFNDREEHSVVLPAILKCCETGEESMVGNERFTRRDGSSFPVEFSARPLHDSNGKIKGAVITFIDSSERRSIESELREARDKALESTHLKSQFLANMSHEIRTPMNGIIGMTGLLLDSPLTKEQREYAETARDCADSLLTLINDILDFSKIEAGKLNFEILDFDLRETVEAVVDLLADTARRKKLELAFYIESEVPARLRGDAGRLRQVLLNLMSNALKFTSSGEVFLLVECEKETAEGNATLRFSIKDTGIGMDSEQQALLFRPFVQADASTTRRFGGTGLGLVISDQLVQMMEGRMGVNSKPGEGSTFWFSARFEKQRGPSPAKNEKSSHRDLINVPLLIVDDNATNRQILAKQASSWEMKHASAANGSEAIALLRQAMEKKQPFEMAIIDYQMPGQDGIMLARAIKKEAALKDLLLILLTSMDYRDRLQEIKEAGFSAALLKPVKPSQLYNCLVEVLSHQNLLGSSSNKAATAANGSGLPNLGGHSMRILIAEDNAINQKVTLSQLRQIGLSAEAVGNGREAVDLLAQVPYDIILMDCQMPEMDGYEAARTIRRIEKEEGNKSPVHIVALTANAMEGDREKCLAAGMNDYVSKPVRSSELVEALERFIKNKPAIVTPMKTNPVEDSEILDPASIQQLKDLDESGTNALLNELCDTFLVDAEQRMEELRKALAGSDMKKVSNIAHALKGGAANFGAKRFTSLCHTIQQVNAETAPEKAASLVATLEAEFVLLKEALGKIKS